jgi:hypothetical protein
LPAQFSMLTKSEAGMSTIIATKPWVIGSIVRRMSKLAPSETDRSLAQAMRRAVPVIAVGAVDEHGIRRQGPVHLEDLWGPVTMAYELDGAWVLN